MSALDTLLSKSPEEQRAILQKMSPEGRAGVLSAIQERKAGGGVSETTPVTPPAEQQLPGTPGSIDAPLETNPKIGAWDRFKYQNLGNAGAIQSLQEQNPDLHIEKNPDGEIIYRDREGGPWHYMDPPLGGGDGLLDKAKEVGQDLTDVVGDVMQGALETAGQIGGGMAGMAAGAFGGPAAPVTVPAGAIAGGFAGGAAAGGLGEVARQGLGVAAGVNTGINFDEVGDASKWAGIFSLVPGASNLPKGAKSQMTKDLGQFAAEMAENPVKGAWNNFMDYASPVFGGTGPKLRRQGRRYADDVYAMGKEAAKFKEKTGASGRPLERGAEEIRAKASKEVDAWKKQAGEAIEDKIEHSPVTYDFGEMEASLRGKRDNLAAKATRSDDEEELYQAVKGLHQRLFTEKFTKKLSPEENELIQFLGLPKPTKRIPIDPTQVSGSKAVEIKNSAYKKGRTLAPNATDVDKEVYRLSNDLYGGFIERIDRTLKSMDGEGIGPLNAEYRDALATKKTLEEAGLYKGRNIDPEYVAPDIQRGMRAVTGIDNQAKVNPNIALETLDRKRGTDLLEDSRRLEAAKNWLPNNISGYGPNSNPLAGGYMGPVMMGMGGIGGGVAYDNPMIPMAIAGTLLGGKVATSPWATEKYLRRGAQYRAFDDKLMHLPEATKRGLAEEWMNQNTNPWQGPNNGGE